VYGEETVETTTSSVADDDVPILVGEGAGTVPTRREAEEEREDRESEDEGEVAIGGDELLSVAWRLIDGGDMHGAISAMAAAMREKGWSEGRIGDEIRAQLERASAAPAGGEGDGEGSNGRPTVEHVSMLEEQERSDILVDCLKDGSSLVCPACHAIVARRRFGDHRRIWCVANGSDIEDSDDSE
jgi:hypothetical protein